MYTNEYMYVYKCNTLTYSRAKLVKRAISSINNSAVEIELFPSSQLLTHEHMFTNTRRYQQQKKAKRKEKKAKNIKKFKIKFTKTITTSTISVHFAIEWNSYCSVSTVAF